MDLKNLTQNDLDVLIARYPLPDGVNDVVMTRDELADAMSKTVNTISQWMSDGMPVKQQGGNGKAYELQLSHCWAWRKAVTQQEDERSDSVKKAAQALRFALVGGEAGDTIDALPPKEKREVVETQMQLEKFHQHRGALLRRDEVHDFIDITFAMIRDAIEAMPDRAERKTALDSAAVEAMITVGEETIEEIYKRISDFWSNHSLSDEKQRADLFNA